MEEVQKKLKWKTIKNIQNGRRSKTFKMEDDQNIKMADNQKNPNGRRPKNQIGGGKSKK